MRRGSAGREPSSRRRCEKRVAQRLARSNLHPVLLTPDEEEDFYNRVCNDTLWPLFHYFSDRLRITPEAWQRYVEVNERFAETILAHCEPESTRLGPRLPPHARARDAPAARAAALDRLLPAHRRSRRPRCTACCPRASNSCAACSAPTTSSFQIGDYARHFRSSCLRILGIDSEPDWLELDGRRVGIGVDPIGIDVEGFRATLAPRRDGTAPRRSRGASTRGAGSCSGSSGSTTRRGSRRSSTRSSASSSSDPESCADDDDDPGARPVAAREPEYRAQRDEIELLISRINGRFGQPGIDAGRVHPPRHLEAGARRALPARGRDDGHGAARRDEPRRPGVRPLPVGARASRPLAWCAPSLRARGRGPGASRARSSSTRGTSTASSIIWRPRSGSPRGSGSAGSRRWRSASRTSTRAAGPKGSSRASVATRAAIGARKRPPTVDAAVEERLGAPVRARAPTHDPARLRRDAPRVRGASRPRTADARDPRAPRDRSRRCPATDVHIVSGRRRRNLEQWFGRLPVHLCAEHGYLARAPGEEWRTLVDLDLQLAPPDRAAPPPCGRRRARGARRAEVVQRRLALPPGGARVRLVARARAAQRSPPTSRRARPRRSCRAPGRRGASAGRRQGASTCAACSRTGRSRRTSCSGSATTGRITIFSTRCRRAPSRATSAAFSRARSERDGRRDDIHLVGPGEVRAFLRALVDSV